MSNNPKIFGKTLKLSWSELAVGGSLSVLGLVLTICPGLASSVVFNAIGIVGIIIGAIHLVRYFMLDTRASLKRTAWCLACCGWWAAYWSFC